MTTELERSYQHCRRIARDRARNFYYGFWLLPKPRRDAFCAVYAFMRYCDDVADGTGEASQRAVRLREWRGALEQALRGRYGQQPVLPAFHDAVQRYSIPAEYFHELISGAEMDLSVHSYRTFDDLYQYCYRAAGVVGLCSLHMMGFQNSEAKRLAESCGIAFQLTNILRDIREDAAMGRVYLPLEDLERFGCSPVTLADPVQDASFRELMRFEIARARSYYLNSERLIAMVEAESCAALWTLIAIYRRILGRIERAVDGMAESSGQLAPRNGSGFVAHPVTLSGAEKVGLVLRAAAIRLQLQVGGKPDWRLDV